MPFCQLNYHSDVLGIAKTANIILPDASFKGPYPVFYLLHGLSDDHSIWMRRTSLERYAEQFPFIIVMPDGGRGFYLDAVQGSAHETAIVRDLIGFVDGAFNTIATREGRCIGGLSMGGYGAMHFALKFPQLFVSANSHSGALDFGHNDQRWSEPPLRDEFERIIGTDARGSDFDLYELVEKATSPFPALRIDCGVDDFLIEGNRDFRDHLKAHSVTCEYAEYSGGHGWDYWDEHIQEALQFHARHLGISPS